MTSGASRDPFGEDVRGEAADWFARMRGPRADALRRDFETWRVADPAHAEAYERLLQHWERTAFLKNAGLARDRDLGRFNQRMVRRRYVAAACATMIALGAISVYMIAAPTTLSAKSLHLRIITGGKERRVVSLDDDTRVVVEARSKLELLFTPQARRVKLSLGRVHFEFLHNDPRPLVVDANQGHITAQQASFDVAVSSDRMTVAALQGSVVLTSSDTTQVIQRLNAGQQTSLPRGSTQEDVPHRSSANRSPAMLSFQAEPVVSAIERFNKASGSKIELSGNSMAERRVSGAFRIDDPLEFARALVTMFGGSTELSGSGRITILPRLQHMKK